MRAWLSSRGMHCPIDCVLCGSNFENTIHILLECPGAMHICREVNLWDKIDKALGLNYNMYAVIFSLLSQPNPSQSSLFAKILWSIWKRKNLKLWQQKAETNDQVLAWATTPLKEWMDVQCIRREGGTPIDVNKPEPIWQEVVRWEKPARGRYKCNIDDSLIIVLRSY